MGFVYFRAGSPSMNRRTVEDLGLGYLLDGDAGVASGYTPKGPSGGAGAIFGRSGQSLHAEGLHWERYPGKEGLWIGWDRNAPPGPADLARKVQLGGHEVELGDGNRWLIPVARCVDGSSPLPRRLQWSPEGWRPGEVLGRHATLWETACAYFELMNRAASEPGLTVSWDEGANTASLALQQNYVTSVVEASLLGLLTTTTSGEVCRALVDWPTFLELLEQEDGTGPKSDGPRSSPGPEDESSESRPSPSSSGQLSGV